MMGGDGGRGGLAAGVGHRCHPKEVLIVMTRSHRLVLLGIAANLAAAGAASAQSLSVYERVRLNVATTANNLNPWYVGTHPGAIAWNGTTVYLAGINATGTTGTTAIVAATDPLATPGLGVVPTLSAAFGARTNTGNSRGFTGLAVSGTLLASAWDNGTTTPATTDGLRAFNAVDGSLLWTGSLSGRQMGGVAFDPGHVVGGVSQGGSGVTGLVHTSGRRPLLDVSTGTTIYGLTGSAVPGMAINTSPTNTEWRSVDFDPATGDIYSRNANNVAFGIRSGINALAGGTQQFLVNNSSNGVGMAGQSLAFLPGVVDPAGSFSGNAVIWNDRPAGTSTGASVFTAANRVTTTAGAALPINWNLLSGSTPANGNGWYDFGYDAATKTLAVMDFQNRTVSIFDLAVDVQTVASGTASPATPLSGTVPLAKRGAGTLVIDQPAAFAAGTVYVEAGTLQVGAGGTTGLIGSPVAVTVSPGATLAFSRSDAVTFAGVIGGSGGVVQAGPGRLTLAAANSYRGPTRIEGGTLVLTGTGQTGSGTITPVAGGTLSIAPFLTTTVPRLDPNAGGIVDAAAGAITVAAGLAPADLVAAIVAGRGDGSWTGASGITSSVVAAEVAQGGPRAIGWLDPGDGSVVFAYAALGDANIDWQVDILDAANFFAAGKFDTGSPATWSEGDFGYDGIVDILDAADFLAPGLYDTGAYNVPPAAVAMVPEPAVGLAAIATAACLAGCLRRRR
jgi:autotransporter-associated beta strand protein